MQLRDLRKELEKQQQQLEIKKQDLVSQYVELENRKRIIDEKEKNISAICSDSVVKFLNSKKTMLEDMMVRMEEQTSYILQLQKDNCRIIKNLTDIYSLCYINEDLCESDVMSSICEILINIYNLDKIVPVESEEYDYLLHEKYSYINTSNEIEQCLIPGWIKKGIPNDIIYKKALVKTKFI